MNNREDITHFYNLIGDAQRYSSFMNLGYVESILDLLDSMESKSLKLAQKLLENEDLNGANLLDVGCGKGGMVIALQSTAQNFSYTGVDIVPNNIEIARSLPYKGSPEFVVGDALELPFPDKKFNVVTNLESSHCYADRQKFLKEVFRVLTPEGKFLYADFFETNDPVLVNLQLQKAGFEVVEQTDITEKVLQSVISFIRTTKSSDPIDRIVLNIFESAKLTLSNGSVKYFIFRCQKPSHEK